MKKNEHKGWEAGTSLVRGRRDPIEPEIVSNEDALAPNWFAPPGGKAQGWFAAPLPYGQASEATAWVMVPAPWFQPPGHQVEAGTIPWQMPTLGSISDGALPPPASTEATGPEVDVLGSILFSEISEDSMGSEPEEMPREESWGLDEFEVSSRFWSSGRIVASVAAVVSLSVLGLFLLPGTGEDQGDQAPWAAAETSPGPSPAPRIIEISVDVPDAEVALASRDRQKARKISRRGHSGRRVVRVIPKRSTLPTSPLMTRLLESGQRTYLQDSFSRSHGLYRRAVRLDPKNAEARFGLALTSFQIGRSRQARRQVSATLALQSDHPEALILLGFLDQVGARLSLAAEHYERYLEVHPEGEWAGEIRSVLDALVSEA